MRRRAALVLLAAALAMTTAVGPSRLAAAAGLTRAAGGDPGFLPEPGPCGSRPRPCGSRH